MADGSSRAEARIDEPTDDDLARIQALQRKIGGRNVDWGARNTLDVWIAEIRLETERQSSRRLLTATWVLAAATIALVVATVGLIVVTVVD